jgi:hypothetical protein
MACLGAVCLAGGRRDRAERKAVRGAQISRSVLVMYRKPVDSFAHHG